ncbi:MAG: histidinol dehydrogenase, partial [Phycisphaerales bacterium]|nr:histidinol dehydrogenase [Phycisphaerales bacterium]
AVELELVSQLGRLETAKVARESLRNGIACIAADLDEALVVVDRLAPEHLELLVADPAVVASRVRHAGALFLGPRTAEAIGDYGAGPNHTLPTGGAARSSAGLSVVHFLRLRTWLHLEGAPDGELLDDTRRLAEMEGLAAHAASAALRADTEGGR